MSKPAMLMTDGNQAAATVAHKLNEVIAIITTNNLLIWIGQTVLVLQRLRLQGSQEA